MVAIGPIKGVKSYTVAPPGDETSSPSTPARVLLVAGSNRGKTSAICALTTEDRFWGKSMNRVILMSPSLGIDDSLKPILAHMKKLGGNPDEDAIDRWDDDWLETKLAEHRRAVEYQKNELGHT